MSVIVYHLGPMDNATSLIVDEATGDGAIVDPSFDCETILDDVLSRTRTLKYVLNTHAHFDHIVGNALFAKKTGALLGVHRLDLPLLKMLVKQGEMYGFEFEPSPEPDFFVSEGKDITLGETTIRVYEVPGHSPGHVAFHVGDTLLSGDCIFQGSIGRTDLPGSSYQQLMQSISTRLLTLPDETRVICGHGQATTIGAERRDNPFLRSLRTSAE